jgi:hypothetical protein
MKKKLTFFEELILPRWVNPVWWLWCVFIVCALALHGFFKGIKVAGKELTKTWRDYN